MKAGITYLIRSHKSSDLEWVIQAHREIPPGEFGFEKDFGQMVAGIVSGFEKNFDEEYEHCWIAEIAGDQVGCVFLVKISDKVSQLRLLLVDPKARGLGIGKQMINECVNFARAVGYDKIVLETDSIAVVARHLYHNTGFRLVCTVPHTFYGRETLDERWELKL